MNSDSQILSHNPILINNLYTTLLQGSGELGQFGRFVQFRSECEPACPGEDGCYGVGTGFLPFLVLAVVSGYGSCGVGGKVVAGGGGRDKGEGMDNLVNQ